MKLGILLLCDHVHPTLQNKHDDYTEMFSSLLLSVDPSLELVFYDVVNDHFPCDIHICDVYMSTGSKFSVNDGLLWIKKLSAFIKTLHMARIGFVGICFGHQLIASALGGKVEQVDKGWGIGVSTALVAAEKSWMQPQPQTQIKSINVVISHKEQITQLPSASEVLMANDFCPYSMFQVSDYFLGIQGHPEFSGEYAKDLINLRKGQIPSDTVTKGLASLVNKPDSKIIMQWLLLFLERTLLDRTLLELIEHNRVK